MYDITKQAVLATTAVHLKGADGEYLYDDKRNPLRVHIYGPGSPQFAEVEARQTNRAVKRMQDNDGKIAVASPETRDAEQAEDLAAITVRFENLTYPPAGDAQGVELFRAMYADKSLGFIPAQLLKAVKDWGNFRPGSAGN